MNKIDKNENKEQKSEKSPKKIIKSTYPENYSSTFNTISYTLERHKVQKTNIVKLAKIDLVHIQKNQ